MSNKFCKMCPRGCRIDRTCDKGFCGAGDKIKAAKAMLHMWEEPYISGTNGSGTIFFSHCNLKCVFCQNYEISHLGKGIEISSDNLYDIMKGLEQKGAHNINLVTPTHFWDYILPALEKFKKTSVLPVVCNTGGYEAVETLKKAEGLVDAYLPDIKYFDERISMKYSAAENYFSIASAALFEMKRQQPNDVFFDGLLKKGVSVRHLVLPTLVDQTVKILRFLAENFGGKILLSLMSQYQPFYRAGEFKEINRKITQREYDRVLYAVEELGFENVLVQNFDSADEKYVPLFDFEGLDF